MEETRTYATHPAAFINQPVAAPHQSQRKHRFRSAAVLLRQLPPGGSQELKRRWRVPINRAFCSVSFGSPSWRPLQTQKPLAISIQRTALLRELREAKSLPYRAWAYELTYHHLQIVYSCNRPVKLLYFLAICQILCYAIPGATSTPVGGSPSTFSGVMLLFTPNPKQRGGGRCVRYME